MMMMYCICARVKEVVCFGEGAGANILTRFAVSTYHAIALSVVARLVQYECLIVTTAA